MKNFFRRIWLGIQTPFLAIAGLYSRIINFFTEDPEDTPLPDVVAKSFNDFGGILEHLDALRGHLLRAVLFLVITTVLSFAFTPRLIDFLSEPIGGINQLQAIDPTEPVSVFMRVALLSGFALALPYIVFELWLFAAPGLKPKTRVFGLMAIPIVAVFFIGGMVFAYFTMLPTALDFLLGFMGMNTIPRPSSYISFVTSLLFWAGITFEFPFVIYVLASMGFVDGKTLAKQWRIAFVVIAILAAAITPTVDPVNMGLLMGPMVILYFVGVGLAFIARRSSA